MMEDGANQGAIVSAVSWIQGGLTGSLASTIAVIAVAFVGLLLLSGRLEMRRAIHVLFGCFILFGASSIASGLMQFMMETGRGAEGPIAPPPVPDALSIPSMPQAQANYDPYAGAAVPRSPR